MENFCVKYYVMKTAFEAVIILLHIHKTILLLNLHSNTNTDSTKLGSYIHNLKTTKYFVIYSSD